VTRVAGRYVAGFNCSPLLTVCHDVMAIGTCSAAGDASAGVQKPEVDITTYRVAGPRSQSRLCVLASATAALPYVQEVLTRAFSSNILRPLCFRKFILRLSDFGPPQARLEVQ